MLSEIKNMDPADERFKAKMSVLLEQVRHHVEEEEQDWFPQVRKAMGRTGSRNRAPGRRPEKVGTARAAGRTQRRLDLTRSPHRTAGLPGVDCSGCVAARHPAVVVAAINEWL